MMLLSPWVGSATVVITFFYMVLYSSNTMHPSFFVSVFLIQLYFTMKIDPFSKAIIAFLIIQYLYLQDNHLIDGFLNALKDGGMGNTYSDQSFIPKLLVCTGTAQNMLLPIFMFWHLSG